jgi:hypothetical protein
MHKIMLAALSLTMIAACNPSKHSMNSLTTEQQQNGWQLLFDGRTTHGWHTYGGTGIGSAWKVNDGMLWLDTSSKQDWQVKNGGDIVTDDEFENFDLRLEWKISKNGNNGVMFYVHEDKPKYNWPWETGPEMQILDNDGHPDGKIHKHRAGDLYDLIASRIETVKPVGEWNQVEIIALNGKLDLYLNGTDVVSTQMWDDNWRALVASSKFKSMPGFGTYKRGRIALQDHGNMVWFRNVMIKRL